MSADPTTRLTAFAGTERIASGSPTEVARAGKALIDACDPRALLIFADADAEPVEMDFRGDLDDVLRRLQDASAAVTDPAGPLVGAGAGGGGGEVPRGARAPGRPRLGVVGREVTLLPRHWEWLNAQPGGASVALRKLVEQARRTNQDRDRVRRAQEAALRFMSAMAGNEVGFEEAARALFAGDGQRFAEHTRSWPDDVRVYAGELAADAFAAADGAAEGS